MNAKVEHRKFVYTFIFGVVTTVVISYLGIYLNKQRDHYNKDKMDMISVTNAIVEENIENCRRELDICVYKTNKTIHIIDSIAKENRILKQRLRGVTKKLKHIEENK